MTTRTKPETERAAGLVVSVLQTVLRPALDEARRTAAGPKAFLPVARMVKLETAEGCLVLSATDLEQAIVLSVGAKVDQPGAVLVEAKLFADLVARLPEERIDLTLDGAVLVVKCARHQFRLRTESPDDFPPIPQPAEGATTLTLSAATLRSALQRVEFAAATDQSRPVLAGVLFAASEDGALTLAAADGFRLAVQRIAATVTAGGQWIVPALTCKRLIVLLNRVEGDVALRLDGRILALALPTAAVTAQLINGVFPNYQQLIPKAWASRTVVQASDLADIADTAALATNLLRLYCAPVAEGIAALRVVGRASEGDSGEGSVDAVTEGEPFKIAVEARYLTQALAAAGDVKVALEATTPSAPMVLRAVEDDSYTHVIMPMFVNPGTWED